MEAVQEKVSHLELCTVAGLSVEDAATSGALNRAFNDRAKNILISDKKDLAISRQVAAINDLAILNHNVLHIFVEYAAHTRSFSVEVYPLDVDFNYFPKVSFKSDISFKRGEPVEQLKALEDKLIELIADAKDNMMGAV